MIGIGSENGVSFTADAVRAYLREWDEEDECDDIEVDEAHFLQYRAALEVTNTSRK